MKRNLLTITLFSILAILPANIFAQMTQNQDAPDALLTQIRQEFTAKKYAEAIETATKALSYTFKSPAMKASVYEIRARSLNNLYFLKGKTIYTDYTFKYAPNTVEKLKLAVSDFGEVINFFKQNPPTNDSVAVSRNSVYSTAANIYWSLGQYSSHQPTEFAKAEELFKLALPNNKNPNWVNSRIVLSLAGQYKFYEARDLAKKVLAAETEEDYRASLSIIVEAFDSIGEYHFADAFLLEQAGIRKAANKSLKPINEVRNSRIAAQKASLEFANPTTVMELNRKGALLAITQQCDKAVPILEKTVNVHNSPTAARFWIHCLMIQQKAEDAWSISNNLIDFDKNDVVALSFRAILSSMQKGEAKTNAEKSEADLSKAISVFPELASFYNALENAKQIYQFQNKPSKVNEIAALEKKFAEINAEINNSGKSDGISDILDEDDEKEAKKPKPTPTKTPEPTQTPVALKTGSLSDCRIILSDGCRNYFFQTPIAEISNQLGIKGQYDRNTSMDIYRGDGIRLIVDPTTGRISSLTIDEYNKLGWKLNNKIKWAEKYGKVEKEFGQGNAFNDGIHYPAFTVNFKFSKLHSVTFFGKNDSAEEEAAYWNRRRTDIKAEKEEEREAEKAANTPEAIERKKQQMETDYNELLRQLDAKIEEGNRIVRTETTAIAAGGLFKDAVQKKIDKVRASGESLIDQFGKKYQGMIPDWMVKGIKEKWTGQQ